MTLDDCRRFYAEEIQYAANLSSLSLIEAFARVPRENFLGAGPWQIGAPDVATGKVEYQTTANADPRHVYHNVTIALDPARNLCNGQPSSLAAWINALDLQPGNRVFHLGCGVGYFTAIMSEVVGPSGSVVATEVDVGLANRARQNLASYSNVEVRAADGVAFDPGMCDAIFINAGVTHPHLPWLDRLTEGGRMILPLTVPMGPLLGKGVMAKVTRKNENFAARMVSFVAIYSCTSARDPQLEPLLGRAMTTGALFKLKSVRRDAHDPNETCIMHTQSMCLSSAAPLSKPAASEA
ncbi:MAG: rRNA adenine N-6-methyltransferase family protein [Terriglobales bacterium]|jgi:protein-L-isoaspartate(D-aspartate) O-methyltransferase